MRNTGDTQGGVALERQTLETARLKLGDSHPVTRKAQNNLAVSLSAGGAIGAAIEMDRKSLTNLIAKQGAGHPGTVLAYANLAGKLVDARRFDEAIVVAEEGLSGMLAVRRTLDFDSRTVAVWQGSLRRLVDDYLLALIGSNRQGDAFVAAEFFKTRLLADRLALDAGELRLSVADRKLYRAALRDLAQVEQEIAIRRSLKQSNDELEVKRLRMADAVKVAGSAQGSATPPDTLPIESAR